MSVRERIVLGVQLRDWPKVVWYRLTFCRRDGHAFGSDADYCSNCGAPWLFVSAARWR